MRTRPWLAVGAVLLLGGAGLAACEQKTTTETTASGETVSDTDVAVDEDRVKDVAQEAAAEVAAAGTAVVAGVKEGVAEGRQEAKKELNDGEAPATRTTTTTTRQ